MVVEGAAVLPELDGGLPSRGQVLEIHLEVAVVGGIHQLVQLSGGGWREHGVGIFPAKPRGGQPHANSTS